MSYLGIDVGGSKTLVAVFDDSGRITNQQKIQTNINYQDFLLEVEKVVADLSTNTNIIACAMAIPGLIDRPRGVLKVLGNLPWKDKTIRDDISKVLGGMDVIIENDSKLAGVAEASKVADRYKSVFYLTISTGIGGALVEDGRIVTALQDMENGHIPLLYEGRIQKWEDFASGKAIKERYGRQASDIEDENQWDEIGERIGYGLAVCCSILQPEVVVFGGGAGQYSARFKDSAQAYLDQSLSPLIKKPAELLSAVYGSDSAINGCFVILRQAGLVK